MHPFTLPKMLIKCTYGYFWHVSRHYANRLLSAGTVKLNKYVKYRII